MIELANGTRLNPIAPYSYKELIQGQQREVFEIHFKADETGEDGYKLEEIVELYRDTTPLSKIGFYEDTPDEEGNYKLLSEHLNFTIAVKFWSETVDDIARYVLKIAQLSDLEITQQSQSDDIAMLTECILEMSEVIYA